MLETQNEPIAENLYELRAAELRVVNYMLLSNANFLKAKEVIKRDDLTFLMYKRIFYWMLELEGMFLDDDDCSIGDQERITKFTNWLEEHVKEQAPMVRYILSQPPSLSIESDLEIVNAFAMKKKRALIPGKYIRIDGEINDRDDLTIFKFVNGRLNYVMSGTTSSLPTELHSTFEDTMNAISKLDLEGGDNELLVTYNGDDDHPDSITSFELKKDIFELKWFDILCEWADRYELDDDTFVRYRIALKYFYILDIPKKGIEALPKEIGNISKLTELIIDDNPIKHLPDEICQLKNLVILSFTNNNIAHIPDDIGTLKKLTALRACNNTIASLPKSFYELDALELLCLHSNNLTEISEEIGNLSHLETLTLSNNDIEVLPKSIVKLKKLKSLDIENTAISSIPIELLQQTKLEKLCINDNLLPFIVKNIHHLNVDTINLTASHLKQSSKILQHLNLNIDTESWIEEKDKRDNGCIMIFKFKAKENEI